MKTIFLLFAVFAAVFAVSEATQVRSCANDRALQDTEAIKISGCTQPPCKLKKRTKIYVEFKFTPESDAARVDNSVYATVFGVQLPFLGVDSTDACPQIQEEGTGKPGCPLKAGTRYTYKNSFDVLNVYPKIKTTVEWALKEPSGKNHICFRVDSNIV